MAGGRLPVMRAAGLAYRDIGRVFGAMPTLAVIAMTILAVLNLIEGAFADDSARVGPVTVVTAIVRGFLLTPFLIAVHRYILLEEITSRYEIAPREQRFFRFFGWSLLVSALLSLHAVISSGAIVTIIAVIVTTVIKIRLTILFPAIAVDAPGATAANAFADTRGYFWDIFFISLMATLPVVAVALMLVLVERFLFIERTLVHTLILTSVELVTYPLFVAIASRIFQSLGNRVLHGDAALGV